MLPDKYPVTFNMREFGSIDDEGAVHPYKLRSGDQLFKIGK